MGFVILAVKEDQAETTPGDCFNGLRVVETNLATITTMDGSRVCALTQVQARFRPMYPPTPSFRDIAL